MKNIDIGIDVDTRILGLIGYPLEHSYSPLLHNHSLKKLGLNYVYLPLEVKPQALKEAVMGLKAVNFRGINVTIPYKEEIIKFLDELDPLAQKIGAVNTVVNENGVCTGYNTDASGFIKMLEKEGEFEPLGKKVVVLGAGGAARAVIAGLAENGISSLTILNRTTSRASALKNKFKEFYPELNLEAGGLEGELLENSISNSELLVDTTPVGMTPNTGVEPLVASDIMHEGLLVVDLVYNPRQTVLLKAAERAGADTLSGLGMLLYQGIEAFELWTGHTLDPQSWWQLYNNFRKE